MSRLNELIEELCPDGVKYIAISELFNIRNGYTPSKANKSFWENGTIPWFRMEDIRENGHILSDAAQHVTKEALKGEPFPANSIIVATSATIGEHALITVPSLANQRFTYLMLKETYKEIIDMKFIYYYCFKLDAYCKLCLNQGNFASVDMKKFINFKFPVPPLEVQHEIIRILDNFTELTMELITQLTVELTRRKEQYEYYRENFLMKNSNNIKWSLLGKECELKAGQSINSILISNTKEDMTYIPCYGANGLRGYVGVNNYEGNYPIIGRQGALCGNVCYASGKFYATEHAITVKSGRNYLPRFLYHLLSVSNLNQYKTAGAQPGLSVENLNKVKLPVPQIEIQKKIVEILDNFEAICTDLNIGLPAEIEARKKQYEYYRDMLLTFVETGDIILQDKTRQDKTRQDKTRQEVIKLLQYVFGYVPVKLEEIATIVRGGNFQKKDFSEKGISCIHYGQIYTHYGIYTDKTITKINLNVANKAKFAEKNDIIMAVTSENMKDVCKCVAWIGNEKIAVSGHAVIIKHNQNPKYLSYYFHTNKFFSQKIKLAHGTKVIEVTPDKLKNIIIPLPPIEQQNKIVEILDHFDMLCNNLTTGIPAEIKARQKQYEYYRDKLLTFKELKI